jgi:gamma-glutamylcyclotransferase
MTTFAYAAYGSNLHPVRLNASNRCPSARLRGTCTVSGWRLVFQKRSKDGSAKGDAEKTENPSDELRIALFDIPISEEAALDKAEGLGHGYHKDSIDLILAGQNVKAKIYLADICAIVDDAPYDWYKEMVLLGAQYNGFPDPYGKSIQDVPSKRDTDKTRAAQKWAEVKAMKDANQALQASDASAPRPEH